MNTTLFLKETRGEAHPNRHRTFSPAHHSKCGGAVLTLQPLPHNQPAARLITPADRPVPFGFFLQLPAPIGPQFAQALTRKSGLESSVMAYSRCTMERTGGPSFQENITIKKIAHPSITAFSPSGMVASVGKEFFFLYDKRLNGEEGRSPATFFHSSLPDISPPLAKPGNPPRTPIYQARPESGCPTIRSARPNPPKRC